ncbi:MAG: MFS transporter [Planctomycetes bacterium]|nr:MFS transporter [Planctomycetota bacterium]
MALLPRLKPQALHNAVRALRHRNYRLFFYGQGISLMGTWLQQVALPWLTFRITGSAFMLGLVGFLSQAPILALGPIAGVVSDRVRRHRLIMVTQTLAMIQAFVLAALTLSGHIQVWQIIVLSITLGCIAAFDIPSRQAFMLQMIDDRQDIGNAIALNSSLVNLARMIGPAIGAALIGVAGEGVCFAINGATYIAAIAALMMMRLNPVAIARKKESLFASFRDGFDFTYGFPPIRALMLLLTMASITGMCFTTLMPVYAKDILGGDESTYSFLMGASGLGALIGAGYLTMRPGVLGLGKFLPMGCGLLGVSMIVFSMTSNIYVAALMRLFGSMGIVTQMAASNTILQTVVDDERRGRVMSFFSMAFIGMAPFGALLGGFLAEPEHLGPRWTVMCVGIVSLVAAGLFLTQFRRLRALMLPVYAKLGHHLPQPVEVEADDA